MQTIYTNIYDVLHLKGNENILFIDGSYFCFHRYHSLLTWWKNANPTDPLETPFQNEIFLEKFKKTFHTTVEQLPKNLKLSESIIIVGKDCKRSDIWRNELYPQYKANRKNEGFLGGPFFKMVYKEELFIQAGAKMILSHPKLEADDCIAISAKYLLEKYPDIMITIVTSDKDYLQLTCSRLQIYNLSYKNIASNKTSLGDSKVELFCKIIMGDPSDNISSVLKKCGPKTAIKCFNDKDYFEGRMKSENAYDKFNLNQSIIDFNYIPEKLVIEFMNPKN
jgi:5'-3' exonuclease